MRTNKIFESSSRRKKNKRKVYAKSTKEKDKLSSNRDFKMKKMPENKARKQNR